MSKRVDVSEWLMKGFVAWSIIVMWPVPAILLILKICS